MYWFYIFSLPFLWLNVGFAYISPLKMILQKTVENNGKGPYEIELEVQFPGDLEPFLTKEVWVINGENSISLTVSGKNDLKDSFQFTKNYRITAEGSVIGANDETFFDKFYFFNKKDHLKYSLIKMNILSNEVSVAESDPAPPPPERGPAAAAGPDFSYQIEKRLRLSRVGGVVNYGLGEPTPLNSNVQWPGLWIEQDRFVLRKLRLPSEVEVIADDFITYPRKLVFPNIRTVKWNHSQVTLKTQKVVALKTPKKGEKIDKRSDSSLGFNLKKENIQSDLGRGLISEFYSRFR